MTGVTAEVVTGEGSGGGPHTRRIQNMDSTLSGAGNPSSDDAISLQAMRKTFHTPEGEVVAVDRVDFTIAKGEVVALLGPNGAGKTTTLDVVLGLSDATSGQARVFGLAPRDAVRTGRISAVLQSGGLLADLKVRETVELIASTFAKHAAVDDVIERAGITSLADRKVSKCSGGEQQRLRFALALLPEPDLLVLDEPTAAMDVNARREFWAAMHLEADAGRTVVFATHYLEEADNFADRIVLIAGGRVIADGSTDEIRAKATGRQVSAALPPDRLDSAVAALRAIDVVSDVLIDDTPEGRRIRVRSGDSDAVARLLLSELGGYDVLIQAGSLEDAFVALTQASLAQASPEPARAGGAA